ncbi:hypothetical protein ABEY96_15295 [Priestia aryabhattai]|uniref:hypothetical protein n=1 Tax=Priestia aryabhattai TaxID=412384 RepID=UPI003D2B3987
MALFQVLVSCPNRKCKHVTKTMLHAISLEAAQNTSAQLNENSEEQCIFCGRTLSYLPIEINELESI